MKNNHPAIHFLFLLLAFAFLAGCEKKEADVAAQDDVEKDQTVEVSTFAGGEKGFAEGVGDAAKFFLPIGIVGDAAGNFYVADALNHRIRKITPEGVVSTLAGGEKGFADGIGRNASFNSPSGMAIDAAGNFYVTDIVNNRIRKITPEGEVSTFAGGEKGFTDGVGRDAKFFSPVGIAIDAAGNLYVADVGNNSIRKITPTGEVSTFAGGKKGSADGVAGNAEFARPTSIAVDAKGNLYVADSDNHRLRKITPTGEVSTLAGGKTTFSLPETIAMDAAGNLYVAEFGSHRIRKITPEGKVSTLAGGKQGFADGVGNSAKFDGPAGIAVDTKGNLYVADAGNHRIRKIEIRKP